MFKWLLLCSGSPRRSSCAAARRSSGAAVHRFSCAAALRSFLITVLRLSHFIVAARRSVDFVTTVVTFANNLVSMITLIGATMRTQYFYIFQNPMI
jgi:hypothetical protein